MTPAIDTGLHYPRLLVPVLELEEDLPDVDARARESAMLGTLVPVQVALTEEFARLAADRLVHLAVVAEFLAEVRHVRPYPVEDVDLGLVRHARLHADGGKAVGQRFPVGAFRRDPLRRLADAADGLDRHDRAQVERAVAAVDLDAAAAHRVASQVLVGGGRVGRQAGARLERIPVEDQGPHQPVLADCRGGTQLERLRDGVLAGLRVAEELLPRRLVASVLDGLRHPDDERVRRHFGVRFHVLLQADPAGVPVTYQSGSGRNNQCSAAVRYSNVHSPLVP